MVFLKVYMGKREGSSRILESEPEAKADETEAYVPLPLNHTILSSYLPKQNQETFSLRKLP